MRVVRVHLSALVLATTCATIALLASHGFSAERPAAPPHESSVCRPGEDLACTVIRETRDGLVLVTKIYRPDERVPPGWSIAFGPPTPATPIAPPPVAPGALGCNTAASSLPNGAPVLD